MAFRFAQARPVLAALCTFISCEAAVPTAAQGEWPDVPDTPFLPDPGSPPESPELPAYPDPLPDPAPAPVPPTPGSVIVSELMIRPQGVPDPDGEYVELYNTTDFPVDLGGTTLEGDAGEAVPIPGPRVIAPHAYLLLARLAEPSRNGGLHPAWAYGEAFGLDDVADRVALVRDGVLVDEVAYDVAAGWVVPTGASLNLAADQHTTETNDAPMGWCVSWGDSTLLEDGDHGTPGTDNLTCCLKC